MNRSRSWALVKKELKEYRRQRFILSTLLIPPIALAILGPLAGALPLYFSEHNVSPAILDAYHRPAIDVWLGPQNSSGYLADHTSNGEIRMENVGLIDLNLSYVILENSTMVATSLDQYSLNHTVVSDSNLTEGVATDSLLLNSALHRSVVENCTGEGLKVWQTTVVASPNLQILLSDGVGPASVALQLLSVYPLLMAILPAVLPATVASYALVGEKINRSLEPLLASPVTDRELLWGKILGILLPTLGVTVLGFGLLAGFADALLYGPIGGLYFPNATWAIALLVLAPLLAFMAITLSIIISSRSTDVRSAQELSSLLALPLLVFFVGGILTTAFTEPLVLLVLGAGLVAIDAVLFWMAEGLFQREKILVTWK